MDIALIALLTLVASTVGTMTGFGTSTIMVPVLASSLPLPEALLLVGIIHWFGDIWKLLLFRSGGRWKLILCFGVTGLVATMIGGLLVFRAPEQTLQRTLGAFLLVYVILILVKSRFRIPQTATTALSGGALYGLSAGIFGVGGAVRGAFLTAYDLPKAVYIFTAGAIGLAIDSGRIATYWWQGAELDAHLLWGLLLFVPISFGGATIAKRVVEYTPQARFRRVVAVVLGLVALQLLFFPVSERREHHGHNGFHPGAGVGCAFSDEGARWSSRSGPEVPIARSNGASRRRSEDERRVTTRNGTATKELAGPPASRRSDSARTNRRGRWYSGEPG